MVKEAFLRLAVSRGVEWRRGGLRFGFGFGLAFGVWRLAFCFGGWERGKDVFAVPENGVQ
jgi:hypothetical protein